MMGLIDHKVERAKRVASFGLGGALCLGVGAGFLTAAGWMALVAASDPMTAALIIGCTYAGLGLILFFIGLRRRAVVAPVPTTLGTPLSGPVTGTAIALALMQGIAAGTAAAAARKTT